MHLDTLLRSAHHRLVSELRQTANSAPGPARPIHPVCAGIDADIKLALPRPTTYIEATHTRISACTSTNENRTQAFRQTRERLNKPGVVSSPTKHQGQFARLKERSKTHPIAKTTTPSPPSRQPPPSTASARQFNPDANIRRSAYKTSASVPSETTPVVLTSEQPTLTSAQWLNNKRCEQQREHVCGDARTNYHQLAAQIREPSFSTNDERSAVFAEYPERQRSAGSQHASLHHDDVSVDVAEQAMHGRPDTVTAKARATSRIEAGTQVHRGERASSSDGSPPERPSRVI
uniref:Uncharacterized protein n=1 Tax=Mycena chlorophos TaxID=658473 RepID=A0ABQ0LBQ8_MYCCL|nr:predicted protein [Mycena chlorophos]